MCIPDAAHGAARLPVPQKADAAAHQTHRGHAEHLLQDHRGAHCRHGGGTQNVNLFLNFLFYIK